MYYIYRFLDKNKNIIYVGKSKQDLEIRFKGHLHLPDECYNLVYKIEYIECSTESDMSIKEIFYINKYKESTQTFFNILDMTELPQSVNFEDKWRMYRGPLPAHFSNSLNYKKGYTSQKEIRYNRDGTINQVKSHKKAGISSYVDGFTREEIDLMIKYMINEINIAENYNQEQIRFRNLVMFILSINLPIKTNDFLILKYKDLFDENDSIKEVEYKLSREQKDKIISIPLRTNVKDVVLAYTRKYGYSYKNNAEDDLFESRVHHIVTPKSWGRIIKSAAEGAKINKNIGAETIRKTYGLNIFNNSHNKLEALLFLGELWGQQREAKIIKYLGLTDDEFDFEYYLGETFSLGNVELSKINCLKVPVVWEPLILQ